MNLVSLVFLTIAITLTLCSSAQADWQYTTWGMSPEQMVEASKGSAIIVPADPQQSRYGFDCVVKGSYQSGYTAFSLTGCFDNQHLKVIVLTFPGQPSSADLDDIVSALSAKYGSPVDGVWTDQNGGNQIHVNCMLSIGVLEILYMPLTTGSGL